MATRYAVGVLVVGIMSAGVGAQSSPPAQTDEELRAHLETLSQRVNDLTVDVNVRERLAQEMAATLDRAATSAPSAEIRRERWAEAAAVLDRFLAKNPEVPQDRQIRAQATVYLWAKARTWFQAYRNNPADASARENAVKELTVCVERFRSLARSVGKEVDVFSQNVRFRLAQALADLDEVGPEDAELRRACETEALEALDPPTTEPTLAGFARLLRATLLARLGRINEARTAIDAASKANPAPPAVEWLEARLHVLRAGKQFVDALSEIDQAKIDPGMKPALRARVRLDQRAATPAGPERDTIETALFEDLKTLRATGRAEARPVLIAAARSIVVPSPGQPPEAWDLLAEGAVALGDPARAGAIERAGADRARTLGREDQAAEFRLRAGAYLFQAEKFAEADSLLTDVAQDPKAGASRVRAGLLRALSRGRALALGRPGASQAAYASALRDQIKAFPNDPSANEARWLLGKLRLAESDRDEALALWGAIPQGSPRWAESRAEIAAVRQHEIEIQQLNNDRDAVTKRLDEARAFLAKSLSEARGEAETNEILVAQMRLELTPGVGRADEAQNLWERLQRNAARADLRDEARRLHIVALAQLNRWVEAEQQTRREARTAEPAQLLDLIRLLDRTAAEAESDLRARRIGLLLRVLCEKTQDRSESLSREQREELRLRTARALLFSGDDYNARKTVANLRISTKNAGIDLLRDLAETYVRLGAYALAVDVQRLRTRLASTGSLSWFDARYGMALAYYRSGKPKDALQLIDATAILHPDLGGGELREKFIRLRQRINPTG